MMWRLRSAVNRIRGIFRQPVGRGSLYRVESLRRSAGSLANSDSKEKNSLSVDKGIKIYEKRQLETRGGRKSNFFTLRNIVILIVLFLTFVYIHLSGYSVKSFYVSEIEEEIKEIKTEREREHGVFLDKVKEIDQLEKNQLEDIILKNSEDYDIKVWKVGRATSLLIGKRTPRNKVDIDISEGIYSNLVSRTHGVLNKVNGVWYYEDLGSQNGSGIEKKSDRRKVKLKRNTPIKVESGDIIYLATTKLLLK